MKSQQNLTADKVIESAGTAKHSIQMSRAGTVSSVFAKAGERSILRMDWNNLDAYQVKFDLSNGTILNSYGSVNQGIIPVGNGWYRCWVVWSNDSSVISFAPRATNSYSSNYAGDGSSGLYLWGAQLESGTFPTSYIPTATTATVTRQADMLTIPTGGWYNAIEGTGSTTFTNPETSIGHMPFAFSNNTNHNRIHLSTASSLSFNIYDGGNFQGISGNYGAFTAGQNVKANLAYKENNFAGSYDGVAAITGSSGTVPAISQLAIGRLTNAGYLSEHIQKFSYYPLHLHHSQLQLLTQ